MTRQTWLVSAAILAMVGAGVYHFYPRRVSRPVDQRVTKLDSGSSPVPKPEGRAGGGSPEVKREVINEETPWGRNPFLTEEELAQGGPPGAELTVKTIIAGRPKSVAIIDGHTVLVGEKIGDETVVEIRPDAVILESGGQRRILRLREPAVVIEVKDRRG